MRHAFRFEWAGGVALAGVLLLAAVAAGADSAPRYRLAHQVSLPGDEGWDYLTLEPEGQRLFIAHGTHVLVVDTGKLAVAGRIADTPGVHGIALAPELNRGYVSAGRAGLVVVFDLKTLARLKEIKTTGENPDAIVYDAATRHVFTFNGRGRNVTAIDAGREGPCLREPRGQEQPGRARCAQVERTVGLADRRLRRAFRARLRCRPAASLPGVLQPGHGGRGCRLGARARQRTDRRGCRRGGLRSRQRPRLRLVRRGEPDRGAHRRLRRSSSRAVGPDAARCPHDGARYPHSSRLPRDRGFRPAAPGQPRAAPSAAGDPAGHVPADGARAGAGARREPAGRAGPMSPPRRAALTALLIAGLAAPAPRAAAAAEADQAANALAHEILKQLVEINTTDSVGNVTTAAEAMAQRFRDAGFPAADIAVLGFNERKKNLVVRLRGTAKHRPVLLIGHLDVVEARREDWSTDPFKLIEKDGYFYGRGTQDMKDGDAIMATTLLRMKHEGFRPSRDIILALTADEEGGCCNGVDWLVRNHRELIDAQFVLNHDGHSVRSEHGVPKAFELGATEKVYGDYQLTVTNR